MSESTVNMYTVWGEERRRLLGLNGDETGDDFEDLENMMADEKVSSQEITDSYYKTRERMGFDSECDKYNDPMWNGFLCLVAMCGRADVFECNEPLRSYNHSGCNPLTVAAYHGNLKLIRILIKAGYHADQVTDEFADIFSGEFFLPTAMNCALIRDDVEVMRMLRPAIKKNTTKLLSDAARNKAEKCFLVILKEKRKKEKIDLDRVFTAAMENFNVYVLEVMTSIGYDMTRRFSSLHARGTMLHAAVELISNPHNNRSHVNVLSYLMTQGVKASDVNQVKQLPVDLIIKHLSSLRTFHRRDLSEHRKYHLRCLDAARILLRAMQEEKAGKSQLIPNSSVFELQTQFYSMLSDVLDKHDPQYNPLTAQGKLALDVFIEMLRMILTAGVTDVHKLCSQLSRTTYRGGHTYGQNDFISNTLTLFSANLPAYEDKLVNFHVVLLAFGMKPDSSYFKFLSFLLEMELTPKTTILIHAALSLMSAREIQRFKQHVSDINRHQNKALNVATITEKSVKSLKESCRRVLYGNIPDRRMAVHVNCLPVPTKVKEYLVFDFKLSGEI